MMRIRWIGLTLLALVHMTIVDGAAAQSHSQKRTVPLDNAPVLPPAIKGATDRSSLNALRKMFEPPIIKPTIECQLCPSCCDEKGNAGPRLDMRAMIVPDMVPPSPNPPPRQCNLWSEAEFVDEDYKKKLVETKLKSQFVACSALSTKVLKLRAQGAMLEESAENNKLVSDYARTCFDERLMQLGAVSTNGDRSEISSNMMFISRRIDRNPMSCHGFRLGNLVVTAQHCIRHRGLFLPAEVQVRSVDSGQRLDVEEILPADDGGYDPQRRPGSDIAVLRLVENKQWNDRRPPMEWLAPPSARGRSMTVQSNIYVRRAAAFDGTGDATSTLRFSDNPLCRLVDVTGAGELLHSCATEHGTSGAPIFQRSNDGKLRLVGVHAGSMDDKIGPLSWRGCEDLNYGVRVPIDRIRDLIASGK